MTHLIAHKVRGEAALDVAEPTEVDGELWWIIPTSGHRAYPFWFRPLFEEVPTVPDGWPDHYAVNNMVKPPRGASIHHTDKIEEIDLEF